MKEYRFNCGNYRHFIVIANDEAQARKRFDKESKAFPGTHGFTLKDVTSINELEAIK